MKSKIVMLLGVIALVSAMAFTAAAQGHGNGQGKHVERSDRGRNIYQGYGDRQRNRRVRILPNGRVQVTPNRGYNRINHWDRRNFRRGKHRGHRNQYYGYQYPIRRNR
ncbi:MAG: hypothetical protein ABIZ95_07270 [Pyrinomonadaceae bacterium]